MYLDTHSSAMQHDKVCPGGSKWAWQSCQRFIGLVPSLDATGEATGRHVPAVLAGLAFMMEGSTGLALSPTEESGVRTFSGVVEFVACVCRSNERRWALLIGRELYMQPTSEQ